MSIDVKDHRRYAEGKMAEHIKAAEARAAVEALLPQSESALANTGDEYLDKLIRAVEELLKTNEATVADLATKGMRCVQEDLFRAHQVQYAYANGKTDAYKEVALIPAKIIAESKAVS